jgi:D-serine deaminase-like pyridoxal phosphate-dependent protein
MGYEGHAVGLEDRARRLQKVEEAMAKLVTAHRAVGGDTVSAGGTGSYDINQVATEIQAGSYALMDTAYAKLGLPFRHALTILATVISASPAGWAVADCGLKALGMDHGNPDIAGGGRVWFCSDEHIVFSAAEGRALPAVGEQVEVLPAHIDPTVAYHDRMHLVDDDHVEILDVWPVDMRGW